MAKADVYNRLNPGGTISFQPGQKVRCIRPHLNEGGILLCDLSLIMMKNQALLVAQVPGDGGEINNARVLSVKDFTRVIESADGSVLGGKLIGGQVMSVDHKLVPSRFIEMNNLGSKFLISNLDSVTRVFYCVGDSDRSFNDAASVMGTELSIIPANNYGFAAGTRTYAQLQEEMAKAESASSKKPASGLRRFFQSLPLFGSSF